MRFIRLVVGLALAFGASSSAFAGDDDVGRFLKSDYTVCDAHFVSKTFDFSLADSKAYIGQKIGWGTTDILDGDLKNARKKGMKDRQWRCQFYQTGFTMGDAEALANYWGISVSDAKVRVEDKILYGNETFLRKEVLPDAARQHAGVEHGGEGGEADMDEAKNFQAFLASKYNYCHAKMLVGSYLGSSVDETKAFIGYKVAAGWDQMVDSELAIVRKKHQAADTVPCEFYETGMTMNDAQALATLWGQSLSDTKARIQRKYAFGTEFILPDEIKRANK
jgi:hypothetical protein